jgi:precorrin-2 dehydrogenase/sirohydrochlorin ferrochelatase
LRKAKSLLDCGAVLRVIAPEFAPDFDRLGGGLERVERSYRPGDLQGSFLAIAATDDEEANRSIEKEAHDSGIPLNVVDRPEQCSFYVPSSVRRGDLLLTVSTGGQLPALSKRLRKELQQRYIEEWAPALELLGEARRRVISSMDDEDTKQKCLAAMASLDLAEIIRSEGEEAARVEIEKCISRF